MKIITPFFDEREVEGIKQVLDSGWVTQGPMTKRFEDLVATRQGVTNAMATTSCTAALHLATMALGLGPGDEVVVPAFTWITSANCAEYVGARAVFADVKRETFNIDPEAFERAITPNTKAVVAVHLFGLAAQMDRIRDIAGKHGIRVIEDAACAIGTDHKGKLVGGIGDIGGFSFHPRKLVTTGEGGMVTTNDDGLADIVRSLRNHGSTGSTEEARRDPQPYHMATFDRLGFNLRMSDIQAAVGVAQMGKLEGILEERRALAGNYSEILSDIEELALPAKDAGHTYQSYVVRVTQGGRKTRNRVMTHLAGLGIETRPGTHAVHCLGYYKDRYGLRDEDFPMAKECEDTTITLPLFPDMTGEDQERVKAGILEGFASR